jgi:sulfate transport system permease protein
VAELVPAIGAQSARRGRHLTAAAGVARAAGRGGAPALAGTYLSLLVLLPVAAVLSKAFEGGPSQLWAEIWEPETRAALELSVLSSFAVVAINAVAGTAVAWLLVRERFFANPVIAALVDLPFALPTVVAGVTLVSLYGPQSPLRADIAYSRLAVVVALAFVTLPFAVRTVQPVLAALERETEEAAASLGARPWTTFRRITLPALLPAMLTGAGLGFARAVGEYGSIALFSGDLPFKTEVASVRIFGLIQSDDLPAASAVSLALFVVALAVLLAFSTLRRHLVARHGSP